MSSFTRSQLRAIRKMPRGLSPSWMCCRALKAQVVVELARKDRARARRLQRERFDRVLSS